MDCRRKMIEYVSGELSDAGVTEFVGWQEFVGW